MGMMSFLILHPFMGVLIVDDLCLVHIELCHLLQTFPDVNVVGEARHAHEAHSKFKCCGSICCCST
jgi:DNA-binding NarL/FixJ family response regulator